jgi:adenylylsulfate kinase
MNDRIAPTSPDVYWYAPAVTRQAREKLHGHRAFAVWFTGLSGAGKSSLAHALEARLFEMGCSTFVFDGDNVRHGLCGDLGFSETDRSENIRRIGEMVRLFVQSGVIALTAFISPFRADRARVRELLETDDFIEVYCRCPLEVCESRDVKGLYRRARSGQIPHFTGVSSPYEPPEAPELVLDTGSEPLAHCVDRLVSYFQDRSFIPGHP